MIVKKRELRTEREIENVTSKNNMKLIEENGEWREREKKRVNEMDKQRERGLVFFASKSCSVQQSHTSSAY